MAFNTFSGSNTGNRAFQLNGEILGGIVVSGTYFGGLPVFTGSTDGIPVGEHAKYALSRSFADNDASGSIIQALNFVKAVADGGSTNFSAVSGALADSTSDIILGDPSRDDNVIIHGSGKISSSAGALIIGGGTTISNTLNLSGVLTTAGNISSSAAARFVGNVFGGSLTTSGSISSSAGALIIGGGTVLSNTLDVSGVITAAGNVSSSAAARFVGDVFGGSLTTSGSISSSAGSLIVGGGTTLSNTVNVSGVLTTAGNVSSSAAARFVGDVFGGSLTTSGSISSSAGNLNIGGTGFINSLVTTGSISSSAGALIIGGGVTLSKAGASALTLSGTLSSSAGASFLGSLFAEDVNVSGTLTAASFAPSAISGNVSINVFKRIIANGISLSASLTGAHVNIDPTNGNANFDGTLVNLGGATFGTVVVSDALTGSGQVLAGGSAIGGAFDAANLRVSGTVFNAGFTKIELNASAKANGIDQIPYIEMMGVDEDAKLQIYKLQVSGGMFQVSQK
jgi:fibronectin-binding autotransporter adhesin